MRDKLYGLAVRMDGLVSFCFGSGVIPSEALDVPFRRDDHDATPVWREFAIRALTEKAFNTALEALNSFFSPMFPCQPNSQDND